ncbi:DUF6733 family protein [Nitrosococcus wardiae]|uniref:Transporter n=1 Tax=Nitrosococcus wardiae TaxID=1814290 RepID=A0A4V1AVV4_9GAMM|nr:DUF6733 family protein [Nitrosococcus wardiae]QBQ54445.1 hypothetical protein E3U44_07945 [Nitrosococcus wardiae]
MRKLKIYFAFLTITSISTTAFAQTDSEELRRTRAQLEALEAKVAALEEQNESKSGGFEMEKFHGGVTLKQDTFFGFQTILDAGYEIAPNIDFSFYTWLWTNPNFGQSSVVAGPDGTQVTAGGTGLWTEVGAGLNFRFLNDALSIAPQIGMLNGALLSSNVVGENIRAGEGVVPNITATYDDDFFSGQIYFAYYMATRGDRPRDFIHNWVNAGVKPALFQLDNVPVNSMGVHWEHLRQHKNRLTGDTGTVYNWIGPYIEFALPMHIALRFAGGFDLKDQVSGDFYQASIKLDF